jgi:hypothetical protein
MKQPIETFSSYEEKLQSFKTRHNLQEVNTSKEFASAFKFSDFTVRLSRSTGQLLGAKAPVHTNYGRIVRYHAGNLMTWFEENENKNRGL